MHRSYNIDITIITIIIPEVHLDSITHALIDIIRILTLEKKPEVKRSVNVLTPTFTLK